MSGKSSYNTEKARLQKAFFLLRYLALERGRVFTVRELSSLLGVSDSSVFRRLSVLRRLGVRIDGAAGVGVMFRDNRDFTQLSRELFL